MPGFLPSPSTRVSPQWQRVSRPVRDLHAVQPALRVRVRSNFIVSNKGGLSNTYHGNAGDTGLIGGSSFPNPRISARRSIWCLRSHGPARVNGDGVASIQPYYQFWWNLHGNWAMRGETGVTVRQTAPGLARNTITSSLSAATSRVPRTAGSSNGGFTWSPPRTHDRRHPAPETYFTLLPGMRCKITGFWYFFASVNVPMTGPQAFSYQPIFAILYDY